MRGAVGTRRAACPTPAPQGASRCGRNAWLQVRLQRREEQADAAGDGAERNEPAQLGRAGRNPPFGRGAVGLPDRRPSCCRDGLLLRWSMTTSGGGCSLRSDSRPALLTNPPFTTLFRHPFPQTRRLQRFQIRFEAEKRCKRRVCRNRSLKSIENVGFVKGGPQNSCKRRVCRDGSAVTPFQPI